MGLTSAEINAGGFIPAPHLPVERHPSWQFVAVGRGHDQEFWTRFLQALSAVDPAWPSTSNTRTPNSVRSRASGSRRRT
jgi:hypothetical protein